MPLAAGTYCPRCTDDRGLLIPFEALHVELTHRVMVRNEGMSRAEAQEIARQLMAAAPAWTNHPATADPREPRDPR